MKVLHKGFFNTHGQTHLNILRSHLTIKPYIFLQMDMTSDEEAYDPDHASDLGEDDDYIIDEEGVEVCQSLIDRELVNDRNLRILEREVRKARIDEKIV